MAVVRRLPALLAAAAVWPLPSVLSEDGGWQKATNDEGKVVQQLKIEAPAMTEEDQYGYVMPERYRCDSCKAVMFHLHQGLTKKHPKSRRMKEWEYTDAFDEVCRTGFEGYGIKLIDGENALSGPGLPRNDQLAPGSGAIQMSSENWSKRLGEICRKIVFEKLGEDETYDRFYNKFRAESSGDGDSDELGLSEALCTKELRECSTRPKPPPAKPADEDKKSKKDKKKKEEKKEKKDKKGKKDASMPKMKTVAPMPEDKPANVKTVAPGEQPAKDEKIDVQTFLRRLAVRHGLTSDEYLASRTTAEWEKLTVAVAGRIFNRAVEKEL